MKPIAIFVLVAAFSLVTVAAGAATAPQDDNDRVVQGVAGPTPEPNKATAADKTAQVDRAAALPSKRDVQQSKVKPKPGLNDPN